MEPRTARNSGPLSGIVEWYTVFGINVTLPTDVALGLLYGFLCMVLRWSLEKLQPDITADS